jgi:hypothetical protein
MFALIDLKIFYLAEDWNLEYKMQNKDRLFSYYSKAAGTIHRRKCKRLDGSDPEISGNGTLTKEPSRRQFNRQSFCIILFLFVGLFLSLLLKNKLMIKWPDIRGYYGYCVDNARR